MTHEWATPSLRQMVIDQIEITSRKFNTISVKTSQEYEQDILEKAQTHDEYLHMVARLILRIKDTQVSLIDSARSQYPANFLINIYL